MRLPLVPGGITQGQLLTPTCETRVVAVVAISLPSRGCHKAQTSQ